MLQYLAKDATEEESFEGRLAMDWDRCIFCDIFDAVASRIKKSPVESNAT